MPSGYTGGPGPTGSVGGFHFTLPGSVHGFQAEQGAATVRNEDGRLSIGGPATVVTPHDGLAPVDGIASWTIADFGGQPVVAVGVHTGGLVLTMPTNGPDPGRASAPGSGGWTRASIKVEGRATASEPRLAPTPL